MHVQSMAQRAYAQSAAPTKTDRRSEYETIARATHELKAAAEKAKADFPVLAGALHRNNRLWTMLAVDVADRDNGLPADLKARIFFLAEFTKRHTAQVLAGKATVVPLLDINTAILRGLRHGGNRA
ncbi:MAG: flagellar biosynthesis regulatory protein FlaF [Rhodobacteraceae bacterium]|nr:MAG: flagellar biosynthesis regulatory protein FlaF [Paracoccaceae bacterium]